MCEEKITSYGSIQSGTMIDVSYEFDDSVEYNFELSNNDHFNQQSENSSIGEKTPLTRSVKTLSHKIESKTGRYRQLNRSISQSIFNVTNSISRTTTSNFLGFGSTSYAVAHMKEHGFSLDSKFSLPHIPPADGQTTTIVSFFLEMSMITGLSVFAIPIVVARCGWPMLPGIILVGLAIRHTCDLINKCQYQTNKYGVRKRVFENYIDLGIATITWHSEVIMKFIVGSSVLSDIYSLIFCAQISKDLTYKYFQLDDRLWMLIWISVVFPLFFIRKMSILAWLGFFSLILYVIGLVIIYGLLVWNYNLWDFANLTREFSISYFFIGYGILVNSFNVNLSIPAIEASMKHPQSFGIVNIIAFSCNTILKTFLAVATVATFGVQTEGSMLTNMNIFGIVTIVINVLIGLNMIAQYPTSLFVVLEMLDYYVMPKFKIFKTGTASEWGWMFLSRLFVVVFIASVAVSVPNFEMVTSFIGNIRGTITTFILPIFFYLRLKKREISMCSYVFYVSFIILVSGLGLAGAMFSIRGILGYKEIVIQ